MVVDAVEEEDDMRRLLLFNSCSLVVGLVDSGRNVNNVDNVPIEDWTVWLNLMAASDVVVSASIVVSNALVDMVVDISSEIVVGNVKSCGVDPLMDIVVSSDRPIVVHMVFSISRERLEVVIEIHVVHSGVVASRSPLT